MVARHFRLNEKTGKGVPAIFYFDFVAFPIVAAALFAIYARSWQFVIMAALGVFLFTFAEYWVHRIALHRFLYQGSHERHHDHPTEYVVFPIYYLPVIFLLFYLIMPTPLFAGFVVGMIWFIYWHHFIHHFNLRNWPRFVQRYAIWHMQHHRLTYFNYGVTSPLWDYVFLTFRKPKP